MKNFATKLTLCVLPFVSGSLFAGNAAQQQAQQVQAANVVTFAQLKGLCTSYEANAQYKPFSSAIDCREEREFYVKTGEQRFVIESGSVVEVKALMKGDRFNTNAWKVAGDTIKTEASCPVIQKMVATAEVRVNIHSCAELANVDEATFCQNALASRWDNCGPEIQSAQQKSGKFAAEQASQCDYKETGEFLACSAEAPVLPTQAPVKGDTVVEQVSSEQISCQIGANAQTNCHADVPTTREIKLGGSLDVERVPGVNLGIFKGRVVTIRSLDNDGLLRQLGFHEGDKIAELNGRRTKSREDFLRYLIDAKVSGKEIRVNMKRQSDRKFEDYYVKYN